MRRIVLGVGLLVASAGCRPDRFDDRYGARGDVEALESEVAALNAALGETEGQLEAASSGADARIDEVEGALAEATSSLEDALVGVEDDLAALESEVSDLDEATRDAGRLSEGTLAPERLPLRERTVPIDVFGVYAPNSTLLRGAFGLSGLYLADEAAQYLATSFVVPSDYAEGPLTIDLAWMLDETGCTVELLADSLDHLRVGEGPSGGDSVDGLTGPLPGAVTAPATPLHLAITTFEIVGHTSRAGLEPGDVLNFAIRRRQQDTCTGPVRVKGLSVRYLAR